jgi:hypothetical protein
MRRRAAGAKGSRAKVGAASGPTPISSSYTTPVSSALPSAYTSEAELDISDPVSALANNIAALTVDVPIANAPKPKRTPIQPFRFFDLPSELRLKVYGYHFANTGEVLDLDGDNYKRIHKKLGILRTCRQVYKEASYVFYRNHTVRIFPTIPKFFKTKKPLLARMSAGQRAMITSMELRLGPGWNRPPRGWIINDALGLKGCVSVRRLRVFIECDPSNDIFKGFRRSDGFYEKFCRDLLDGVLAEMPWCGVVEFDAYTSVKKNGAMMHGLLEVATSKGRKLAWGPEKGWDDGEEKEEPPKIPNHGPIGVRHVLMDTSNHPNPHGHNIIVVA